MKHSQLEEISWFSELDHLTKAQLVLDIEVVNFAPGDKIFEQGDAVNSVHYFVSGLLQKELDGRLVSTNNLEHAQDDEIPDQTLGFLGHEVAAYGDQSHPFTLIATTSGTMLSINQDAFTCLIAENYDLRSAVYRSIIFGDTAILDQYRKEKKEGSISWTKEIWWILALVLPLINYYFLSVNTSIDTGQIIFSSLVLASLALWIGEVVPVFAPAITILIGLVLLNIAPQEVVLSGFGNQSFLFMISLFVIGGLIKQSGLAFRLCLLILKRAPQTKSSLGLIMFFMALFLNPILPSASSRTNILAPILTDMKRNLRLQDRSPLFTLMTVSMWAGISTFSFVFISAKSDNLILFALLPNQVRDSFGYGEWIYHSLAIAVPFGLLCIFALAFLFKKCSRFEISRDLISTQLTFLGPLTTLEYAAMGSIFIFLVGTATLAIHGFSSVWVSLMILCYLLFTGIVKGGDVKSLVDWPFLLFLSSIVGLSSSIPYSDFDDLLTNSMQGFGSLISYNLYLFVLVFAGIVYLLRLFLPGKLCGPLLATIFIPLFSAENVNPWILCMCCLMFTDAAFFPYQHPALSSFLGTIRSDQSLDRQSFWKANWVINVFRIAAVLLAIPVWQLSGIS
ncbi:SLC13 family permease [Parasynechococcus sp.]|uniref:SLC13 family permease n=1 Tax=Parasynechococcus sp. TaxID=3101203 RepID=UPI0037038AD0